MNTRKKWMVSMSGDYFDWIKSTSEKTGLKGSQVIEEMIARTIKDKEFVESLADAQVRIQEQQLLEQRRQIDEKIRQLKMSGKQLASVR